MDLLYEQYFGLRKAPFNITADPEFLYLGRSHRDALAQLSYALKTRRGFVVLTGEVGTGKTTVIRALLSELRGMMRTAFVTSHIGSPSDLLCYTCAEFGLSVPRRSRNGLHEHVTVLNNFLMEAYGRGQNCTLVVDEAQNLSGEVLESIRMLSNFESPKDKLLQIMLVGQPELAARLNTPELRQLKQRVVMRHHLRPLTLKECREYIATRLRISGADPKLFAHEAIALVYESSAGIPRVINVICDNALLTGFGLKRKIVDESIVRQVVEDLDLCAVQSAGCEAIESPSAQVGGKTLLSEDAGSRSAPRWVLDTEKPNEPMNGFVARLPVHRELSRHIIDELIRDLQEAMGPMASLVLEDHMRRIAPSTEVFPREQLGTLIEAVCQEIDNRHMQQLFRRTAEDRLRDL